MSILRERNGVWQYRPKRPDSLASRKETTDGILEPRPTILLATRLIWASAYPSYVCHRCRKLIADFPEVEQSEPLNNKEKDLW